MTSAKQLVAASRPSDALEGLLEQAELKPPPTLASDADIRALWFAGILDWLLWPQQLAIYDVLRNLPLHVLIIVFLLARQFGKSVLSVLIAVEDCLRNPDIVVVIIAPKVDQAVSIVRPRMKLLTKTAPKWAPGPDGKRVPFIRPAKAENAWYFWNGSELRLGGYSSGAVSQRGKTLYKVILEEFGADTDAEGYLDFLRSDVAPALQHSPNAQMVFPTTLPKIPDHPFITETIPEAQLHGAFFIRTIDDNDALSPEQKERAIRLAGGRDSDECRRELYCEMIRDPKLVVVPSYVEAEHGAIAFELPQYHYMQLTGDMGGTRDKTAWLLHTYDFFNDVDLIWDELVVGANTSSGEIIRQAREKWGAELGRPGTDSLPNGTGRTVKLDAPARQFVDMSEDHTFHASLVDKQAWAANVNAMDVRFRERSGTAKPKILVHPRCTFLRLSLRSGTLNKLRTDFARSEVLGHMDALAALMYALRAQTRTNPWPAHHVDRDFVFQRTAPTSENESIARAIQPKTFGKTPIAGRKFGTFKKG